jgi:hypothetical protein
MGTLVETYEAIPGYGGAGPLLVDPRHPHVNGSPDLTWAPALDNPILKSETLARLAPIGREAGLLTLPAWRSVKRKGTPWFETTGRQARGA